jgi:hypothetical protein
MDIPTVIATTSSALLIGGSMTAGIRWILKTHTQTLVKDYLSELKPNHGTSLNDVIRLEVLPLIRELREHQQEINSKVDKLEGRFEQHVEEWE